MRGSCICAALLLPPLGTFTLSNTGLTAEPRAKSKLSGDSNATARMPPSPWLPELHMQLAVQTSIASSSFSLRPTLQPPWEGLEFTIML